MRKIIVVLAVVVMCALCAAGGWIIASNSNSSMIEQEQLDKLTEMSNQIELYLDRQSIDYNQNSLQTGITTVPEQDISQFSNVIKRGSVVRSAITLYQGEPVAILVKTNDLAKDVDGDCLATDEELVSGIGDYFNYNCLLKAASGSIAATSITLSDGMQHIIIKDADTSGVLSVSEDGLYFEGALHIQNGVKSSNYEVSCINDLRNVEYISDDSLFDCKVIKDISGSIIGICFTQTQ